MRTSYKARLMAATARQTPWRRLERIAEAEAKRPLHLDSRCADSLSANGRRIAVEESANLGPADRGKTSRGFGEDGAKVRAVAPASIKTKTFRSRRDVLASEGTAERSEAAVGPQAVLCSTAIRRSL